MSELDIRKWLSNVSASIAEKDIDKHMSLVSESVAIYGMPDGNVLNYADWKKRRQSEFKRDLLKSLTYDKLQIKNIGLRRIKFNVVETMCSNTKDVVIINKDIILENEPDNQWRVVEETIQNWNHMKVK